jgi:glycosyl transferase, family 25
LHDAAKAGQSVLILEDDCDFIAGAQSYEIPTGWDIFYGGHNAADPDDLQNSDIMGAHMMGFSRAGALQMSAYLEQLHYDGIHPPIDAAYVWFRRANPDTPTYFAVPPLAGQRASRSDIADLRWYDKLPLIRQLSNALRTMRTKAMI